MRPTDPREEVFVARVDPDRGTLCSPPSSPAWSSARGSTTSSPSPCGSAAVWWSEAVVPTGLRYRPEGFRIGYVRGRASARVARTSASAGSALMP